MGEVPPEIEPVEKPGTRLYAMLCGALASMSSVIQGYDIGVMSGAANFLQEDLKLTDTQLEILVGCISIFALLGAAVAGRTSDWIGRRYTIVLASACFFIGALFMAVAPNYTLVMVGRFIAGIGCGYAIMIGPCYTAEVAPTSCRGFLTTFPEVFVNIGILLGYVMNIAFSGLPLHLGWRLMLGAGAIPALLLAAGILAMPESPRWLVLQGRIGDAKKALEKISNSKEEARSRLADVKEAAGIPQECTDDVIEVEKKNSGDGVWKDLFLHPTPAVKRVILVSVGFHLFQQVTGIDAVVLYSPRIFAKAGITGKKKTLGATAAVGVFKTLFTLVATVSVDKVGRRTLVLCSMGGIAVALLLLGSGLTVLHTHPNEKMSWAVIMSSVMVFVYVMFFSIGMGPVAWVYTSEIFPLRLRAQGCSLGVAVNRAMSGIMGMTFLSFSNAVTIGGAFLIFGGLAIVAWLFFFACMPETRGRTLEEMDALFEDFRWGFFNKKSSSNGNSRSEETTPKGDVQMAG